MVETAQAKEGEEDNQGGDEAKVADSEEEVVEAEGEEPHFGNLDPDTDGARGFDERPDQRTDDEGEAVGVMFKARSVEGFAGAFGGGDGHHVMHFGMVGHRIEKRTELAIVFGVESACVPAHQPGESG